MGAFAINSMLNPYSEEDHEKELKEKCMLGRCDTEKLAFLIHDKINATIPSKNNIALLRPIVTGSSGAP